MKALGEAKIRSREETRQTSVLTGLPLGGVFAKVDLSFRSRGTVAFRSVSSSFAMRGRAGFGFSKPRRRFVVIWGFFRPRRDAIVGRGVIPPVVRESGKQKKFGVAHEKISF
jgi:hypothetical protein